MGRLLILGAAIAVAVSLGSFAGSAQPLPPPPGAAQPPGVAPPAGVGAPQAGRSPVCVRLEGQLASLDRNSPQGGGRSEQVRRYEEAAGRQQAELDRATAQFQRLGCESGGGFFLFRSAQNPQCDPLQGQIRQMRSNLEQMLQSLQRMQDGGGQGSAADEQRRAILIALGQNDCGPQYRTAAASVPQRSRGWFDSMFGSPESSGAPVDAVELPQTGGFRTVCVRTCDGYFFPISYSASQSKFPEDERTCQRMCPAAEAVLYTHRSQGEDIKQAVSMTGAPYTQLPAAFRYRTEINQQCTCKRAGESWAEAMKGVADESIRSGDIVVTDETAKALSQPKADPPPRQQRQNSQDNRTRTQQGAAAAPSPSRPPAAPPQAVAPAAAPEASAPADAPPPPDRPRSVGSQFYR